MTDEQRQNADLFEQLQQFLHGQTAQSDIGASDFKPWLTLAQYGSAEDIEDMCRYIALDAIGSYEVLDGKSDIFLPLCRAIAEITDRLYRRDPAAALDRAGIIEWIGTAVERRHQLVTEARQYIEGLK